jgi:hypothetical protein
MTMIEITCEIVGETEQAIRIWDGSQEFWLPKSQTNFDEIGLCPGVIELEVAEWLAQDKGLI